MPQAQQNDFQVTWSTGNTHRLLDLARAQKAVKPMRSAIYAAQQELAAEEQKHLKRIAELEAELAQAKAAQKTQTAPNLDLTDEALTTIYKTANDEVGKARPLTTESIFKAMRAVAALATARTLGATNPAEPKLDTIRLGGWCETHLAPKPCWHCPQVEKRDVGAGSTK